MSDTPDKKNETPKAADAAQPKRPHATIDLKATDISPKDTSPKTASVSSSASASSADKPASAQATPSASATASAVPGAKPVEGAKSPSASSAAPARGESSATAKPASPPIAAPPAPAKSGGVLSHLAAGLIGGILALTGSEFVLPTLGVSGLSTASGERAAALETRLAALEKSAAPKSDIATALDKVSAADKRVAAVESASAAASANAAARAKFETDTRTALDKLTATTSGPDGPAARIAKLESRLALLSAEGSTNPEAGRVPQLAAITGKIADLEAALENRTAAIQKSISKDIGERVASVAEASETAKSGTQRLDKEVATARTDTTRLAERLQNVKTEVDRTAEALRIVQEDSATIKTDLQGLKSSVAKPADVASAIAPVTSKLASLEQDVGRVMQGETDRKINAERIVLALELANLKRALDRGQPYAPEFAGVEKAAHGKVDLGPLARYKNDGVIPLADLTREFRSVANAAIDADGEAEGGGVIDKLLAGAKSVVRIRKIEHSADDTSTEAIIGRMSAALTGGRLGEFLEEAKRLSPKPAVKTRDFVAKVEARHTTDRVIASLENELKASLGGTPVSPAEPQAN